MIETVKREEAKKVITDNHYSHSFPSGWTSCYKLEEAYVVFAIPANKNLEGFLFKEPVGLRELSRLWAPDGHAPNLLTRTIAASVKQLRADFPVCEAVVSFADPNQGHLGGVYRAASWLYHGQSSEGRVYRLPDGTPVSRRSFHSGSKSLPPRLPVTYLPGKHRFVRCLTVRAKLLLKGAV